MNRMTRINCTAPELEKVGVALLDYVQVKLQCRECGAVWKPEYHHGQLVMNYWHCPGECNRDANRVGASKKR